MGKKYGDARITQHSSIARMNTENGKLEEKYLLHQEKDGQLGGNEVPDGGNFTMKGGPWYRYSQTKLANSVFNQALADRLKASKDVDCQNIVATCAHPGVSRTNLSDHLMGKMNFVVTNMIMPVMTYLMFQSAADGSMGILRGMMDDKLSLKTGTLYGPSLSVKGEEEKVSFDATGSAVANPELSYEIDPSSKDMLWNLSEKATGVKFTIP